MPIRPAMIPQQPISVVAGCIHMLSLLPLISYRGKKNDSFGERVLPPTLLTAWLTSTFMLRLLCSPKQFASLSGIKIKKYLSASSGRPPTRSTKACCWTGSRENNTPLGAPGVHSLSYIMLLTPGQQLVALQSPMHTRRERERERGSHPHTQTHKYATQMH